MIKHVIAVCLILAAAPGFAQVQVIESQPIGGRSSPGDYSEPVSSDARAELYTQLQQLQQEVQELRGLVEQQSHELRQLKQQRTDDYMDLDRRVSHLSGGRPSGEKPGSSVSATTSETPQIPDQIDPSSTSPSSAEVMPSQPAEPQVDEMAVYRSAMDQILKQRNFVAGSKTLKKYLQDFPNGQYAANAKYWLGQIAYQKEDFEQSMGWFSQLVDEYPSHQKSPEAKYKLGRIYHTQGQMAKSRALMMEVASSGTAAAALAKEFLEQNP
jgi:tol-pal system protein YbgF